MNYAQIRKFDVTNGPGVRETLFVSGCSHKCPGCFNDKQQDFNYGNPFTKKNEDDFINQALSPNIEGISILGGEPFEQLMDDTLINLLKRLNKEVGKPIWIWSGYKLQDLLSNKKRLEILKQCDVLIDGQFQEKHKDLSLKYRGSSNQRVIDIKKTLLEDKIILLDF